MEFKPELLQDGQVDRLSRLIEQVDGASETYSDTHSSPSSLSVVDHDCSSRETSVGRSTTVNSGSPVAMKDPKTKWDDDELQKMMQLRKFGLTHKAVAVGLPFLNLDMTRLGT